MNKSHDYAPAFRARDKKRQRKYSGYWLFACGAMYMLWMVIMFDSMLVAL